jgi:predicted phosphodiesterase
LSARRVRGKSWLPRIAVVGDTHHPWASWSCLNQAAKIIKKESPDIIVQMGDAYDFYSWTRWAKDLNLMTPEEEIQKGRRDFERMWSMLLGSVPHCSEAYQLLGNHDDRVLKQVADKYGEVTAWFDHLDFRKHWRFEGVTLQESSKEELVLHDIVFQHGHAKEGSHFRHNLMNTVVGHLHRGYTIFDRIRGGVIWELNAGSMIDKTSKVFDYVPGRKFSRYTNGLGFIDEMGPRFIPYLGD